MRVFGGWSASWGRNVAEVDLGEMRQEGLQGPERGGLWTPCGGLRTLSHRSGSITDESWRPAVAAWRTGCVAGVTPGAEEPMRGLRSDDAHPGGQRGRDGAEWTGVRGF